MSLLVSRRLLPLLVTQTLGAVNDNLFKNALVVLVLFRTADAGGQVLVAVAGGLFILPYVLLSAAAGQIADRAEKSRAILALKLVEVALMALAAAGLLTGSRSLLFAVLFGLGVQASFFSPLKYGILPSLLRDDELVAGNGLIEAGTFLGILAGTIAGSGLMAMDGGALVVSVAGLVTAGAGVFSAAFVPRARGCAGAIRIGWNPVRETAALLAAARANRPVWLSILGLSWFWTVGAIVLTELPSVVRDDLGAGVPVVTLLLACFCVGIGAGSVLCGRLLHGEATARLVPFAALGLSLFLWDFTRGAAGHVSPDVLGSRAGWHLMGDLVLLAACGGLFSVPLYAIIQAASAKSHMARMIAANNVVNAAAVAAGAAVAAALAMVRVAPLDILAGVSAANLLVAAWIVRLLPQTTVRAVFRCYFRAFHGVTVTGQENLPPDTDRAVVVVNHQSLLDGCFVAAFLPGTPVFAVDLGVARQWWARLFLAAVRFFPVDSANPFSTRTMANAVQNGARLVIFPEGRLTMTGGLMKIYDGAGMVADKAGAVIVPVHIDGLQVSPLARLGGRRWFPRLSLHVSPPVRIDPGAALKGRARRRAIGAQLRRVMEDSAFAAARTDRTLFAALVDARTRYGRAAIAIEDTARAPLTYNGVVLGAAVLGRRLARLAPRQGTLGLMLPNANGAVVTFMAMQAFGLVPAMLNYASGAAAMLGACEAAGVTTIVSSRAFVERAKLAQVVARMEQDVRFIWLEDVRAGIGAVAKLRGWLDSRRPHRLPGAGLRPDAPAAVLFTSGSEGAPKGVALSHRNILANIAQVAAVIDFNPSDRVFNAMPMFHAFGLTGGTLLPLLSGVRSVLYPSPLHYRIVPELIYATDSTIAFGTDTFLAGWARFAHPGDFYRMRMIVAGAEKLREETRRLYADRFGVRVLEGYGATETAPVLALNTPMQNRPGSVGRLLPGVAWRLDPVEGIAHGGRLAVRGPNVMRGYLRASAPGVLETLPDGWYDTGDICTIDADGFVTVTGRAKRFAKIAGEMVSMPAAEALAGTLWPDAEHAVVAVPDGRKGEALVLLTTHPGATAAALLAHARLHGVTEIAVPRLVTFVGALPRLAAGKIDYVAASRLAGSLRAAA